MSTTTTLNRRPFEVVLEDRTRVTVRPLSKHDKIELARFFMRVPEEDRFYLKENVTAPEVIHRWTEHIDAERVVPIVAVADGKIVADATLHRSRAPARRHVGELRIVVDTAYRGNGLASRLIEHLIEIGRSLDLYRLVFELVDVREIGAIRAASSAGFSEVCILRRRIKDMYGAMQDLVIMELPLG